MNWNKWKKKWVMFSFSVLLPVMVIAMVGFVLVYPLFMAGIQFDKVEDQMFDDIEDADCSDDFRDGWVAAVNHFGVLWRFC